MCKDWSSEVFQQLYSRRLFPSYIVFSLIVVYYGGGGVVPNGSHGQSSDIFCTIAMHVDSICECAHLEVHCI